MKRVISQNEARRYRAEVGRLKEIIRQFQNGYRQDWPDGTHITTLTLPAEEHAIVRTARRLGFGVFVTTTPRDSERDVHLWAVPIVPAPKI